MMSQEIQALFDKCLATLKALLQIEVAPEYHEENLERYHRNNAEIFQHQQDLQQTYDLLCDEASKKQFLNFLGFRLLMKIHIKLASEFDKNITHEYYTLTAHNLAAIAQKRGLVLPELKYKDIDLGINLNLDSNMIISELVCSFGLEQYAYNNIVTLNKNDVALDCGAFIGDTVIWAAQRGAEVHAFEPIGDSFKLLQENLKLNGITNAFCYNLGVSEHNRQTIMKLPPHRYESAFLNDLQKTAYQEDLVNIEGTVDTPVTCVSLDSWLADNNIQPSFIKMDIEGAELSALRGAQQTITELKPKLAICLYHTDADLWAIPLYIHSLVPEYKFYCRENAPCCEFVLYATV